MTLTQPCLTQSSGMSHALLHPVLARLAVELAPYAGSDVCVRAPRDGGVLAQLRAHTSAEAQSTIAAAHDAFLLWRNVPAPARGELLRRFGDAVRRHKADLGELVSLETGKIRSEGLGEVQEMIDICDFALGLSRQLYGLTIASERPGHRMMETWHPVGVVGVISAFNFPVAVWAWNSALALVCGNAVVWKPSEKTPLTAIACHHLLQQALRGFAQECHVPNLCALGGLLLGGADLGAVLSSSAQVPVLSATGSTRMGRSVATAVAARLGRSILELGGNNAMIVAPSADLEMAARAITFAACGTAGQRCTTLRRLIVHRSVLQPLLNRLQQCYRNVRVGDPLAADTLVGPLVDQAAFVAMHKAVQAAQQQGGELLCGGERVQLELGHDAYYVRPALISMPAQSAVMQSETFAPILYVLSYEGAIDAAIALQNGVPQGLSSAIFTTDMREAEHFMSTNGSDCGIANVNIGTSGAEIGGAFGGEKETGGGRESGSDAWKGYMRRATNTINYSRALPLAQGVCFDV